MTFPRNSEDDALESDDADKAASPSEPRAAGSLVSHERIGRVISFPRERSVLDYFQTLVQSQPEAVAIKDGVRLMTYTELDLLSNRVANELRRQMLKLEESVMILHPASCEFLAGVLGVLKAGGTGMWEIREKSRRTNGRG